MIPSRVRIMVDLRSATNHPEYAGLVLQNLYAEAKLAEEDSGM
jgi:hypothetical protein